MLAGGTVLTAGGSSGDSCDQSGGTDSVASAELFQAAGVRPAPVVQGVDPPSGPTFGQTQVTVRGKYLFPYLFPLVSVAFGGANATVSFSSDTRIVVSSPPQAQGVVHLTVTTPAGSSPHSRRDQFTYGSGAWSSTGTLDTARYGHTATLLPNGKVLVVGGTRNFRFRDPAIPILDRSTNATNTLSSAELFDPSTGSWTSAGSMSHARFAHTATLLDGPDCRGDQPPKYCGKVLVAGGQDGYGLGVAVAELYDPTDGISGKWDLSGSMTTGRFSHTATLLPGGHILVSGGSNYERGRPALGSSEIYDATIGIWRPVAPLLSPRQNHTATLLPSGEGLVIGGLSFGDDVGNYRSGVQVKPLNSTEIFRPSSGAWMPAGPVAVARFAHSATQLASGRVLVSGGSGVAGSLASAELYDPSATTTSGVLSVPGSSTPTGSLNVARSAATSTLLPDGRVLVAGSGPPFPDLAATPPTASSEVYDPGTGTWSHTSRMSQNRGLQTATLLGETLCGSSCGKVLLTGGGEQQGNLSSPSPLASSELYTPAPSVSGVKPARGSTAGGSAVAITGFGFRPEATVTFGDRSAPISGRSSPTQLTAVAPEHAAGPVDVAVVNEGGTSAHITPERQSQFVYAGGPGRVTDLAAVADSRSQVILTFTAPDDGTTLGAATSYIVKQSTSVINADDEAGFDAADSLCGGICLFTAGRRVTLAVNDLEPATTYHYAVRALGPDGAVGPISNPASATTATAGIDGTSCPKSLAPVAGRVLYTGGSYHLAGLPGGSVLQSTSPLYGWSDQGAGGSYSIQAGNEAVASGRGYWTWSACDRLVVPSGAGDPSVTTHLGAYRASMVGNPSARDGAVIKGHDFAVRWDPTINDGGGGYRISGYREPEVLAAGEGAWVFNYSAGEVTIRASE